MWGTSGESAVAHAIVRHLALLKRPVAAPRNLKLSQRQFWGFQGMEQRFGAEPVSQLSSAADIPGMGKRGAPLVAERLNTKIRFGPGSV